MISITIKDKEFNRQLEKLAKKHSSKLYMALVAATAKTHKLAVHDAPVDDGTLRREIEMDITRAKEFTGVVISKANYSQAVEEGTRPHKIEIRRKKVLAGKGVPGNRNSGGWSIWGRVVQHPGTKPQPFMHPAFIVGKNYLYKKIKDLF